MRSLRLVALSDDGKHLVLAPDVPESADSGERFEVPIDDRLRTAVRGDSLRPGQASADPGNALPPRVIQARIRAGETPEQVAHASGTSVERIMRFAHPVLQERERVAEQAREARVRLSEGTPSVPLEQFMAERLRLLGADLDAVRWDAHRTEDGTWQVRAAWRAGHKSGTTRWRYDIPTKTVSPIDATTMDFAEGTRLVRVVPDVPAGLPTPPPPRRGMTVLPGPEQRPVAGAASAPGHPGDEPTEEDAPPADPDTALRDDESDEHGDEHGDRTDAEGAKEPEQPDIRNVVPVDGTPVDILMATSDDIPHDLATQDTLVLGELTGEEEASDPRARIPAWEDIVFGVRRHR